MAVFRLIVIALFSFALIFLIYNYFLKGTNNDANKELAILLEKAYAKPGSFFYKEIYFKKGYYTKNQILDFTKLKIKPEIYFLKENNENIPFIKIPKAMHKNVSVICLPSLNNSLEKCFIYIGLKKEDKKDIKKIDLNNKAFEKISFPFNKKDYKIYYAYNLDKFYNDAYINSDFYNKYKELETDSLKDVGKYTIIAIEKCSMPCAVQIYQINLEITPNMEAISQSCKTGSFVRTEYNFEKEICIEKYSCSGCVFASDCADAWHKKDGRNYIEYSPDIAIYYEKKEIDNCGINN